MKNIKYRAWVCGEMLDVKAIVIDKTITTITQPSPFEPHIVDSYNRVCLLKDVYLMQFTGIKDRNGTEIYEGDILRYPRGSHTAVVVWLERDCSFRAVDGTRDINFSIASTKSLYPVRARVIGNIFENPELEE